MKKLFLATVTDAFKAVNENNIVVYGINPEDFKNFKACITINAMLQNRCIKLFVLLLCYRWLFWFFNELAYLDLWQEIWLTRIEINSKRISKRS